MDELLADEGIRRGLESGKLLQERSTQRSQLLGNAVMVEPSILPHLASAIGSVVRQFPEVGEIECFVYSEAEVNAFVTTGRTRTLIGVSSAAVNHFSDAELCFVIGHEVGHALFQHKSLSAGYLVALGDLSVTDTMRVRAWQRAAEISADRAGLVACGTIESAAHALFKSASGIVSNTVQVSPVRFAEQWHRLLDEVIDEVQRDLWQISHPFPPLRMRALMLFWESVQQPDAHPIHDADTAIEKMLAIMDPATAKQALQDPMLRAFFFWGGIYAALSDGTIHDAERRRLESVAPATVNTADAIQRAKEVPASCLEAFTQCHRSRRKKLSAAELHRIVFGLIDVVAADGPVNLGERSRLKELVGVVGIQADACDLLISQYEAEARRED